MLAKKQARQATKAEGDETKAEAPAEPVKADDLTKIEGIGPRISGILKDAGIITFAQLADTEIPKLKDILEQAQLRVPHDPTSWPQQAKLAAGGKWNELEALQDKLHGGRHKD